MQRHIDQLIRGLHITLVYDDGLDKAAHYIALFNIIVVNSTKTIFEQQKATLHELGHACKHHDEIGLYNLAHSLHSKMEFEADAFMIEKILLNYISETDIEPSEINSIRFIESFKIDSRFEEHVKMLLNNYQTHINLV